MFTKAIDCDPENGRAYAEKCCTLAGGLSDENLFPLSYDEIFQNCQDLLKQAFELTNQDWDCHRMLCNTYMYFEKYEEAEEYGRRGYNLNPNNPGMLHFYGKSLVFNGDFDQGLNILNKAMELDPLGQSIADTLIWANYAAENFEECLEFKPLNKCFTPQTWILRIACLGVLSRDQEKKEEFKAFIDFYSREEMNKRLADLKFNNTEIESNIRLLVSNDMEYIIRASDNKFRSSVLGEIN